MFGAVPACSRVGLSREIAAIAHLLSEAVAIETDIARHRRKRSGGHSLLSEQREFARLREQLVEEYLKASGRHLAEIKEQLRQD